MAAAGRARPWLTTVQLGVAGFEETEGVLAAWFSLHGVPAALVRPDHYVYGVPATADALQAQLADLEALWLSPLADIPTRQKETS